MTNIRSIRYGFATNSSSSHSVIFHPRTKEMMLSGDTLESMTDCGYTASTYTAADIQTKLGIILYMFKGSNAQDRLSGHDKIQLIKNGVSVEMWQKAEEYAEKLELESAPHELMPPAGISMSVWMNFILDPNITIHGYYDDIDLPPEMENDCIHLDSDMKYKMDGNALIGYNRDTGEKVRWSPTSYEKSTYPELVDLKITDYCGYGCKFCYQGSTTEGVHAPYKQLKSTIEALGEAGVFEIAIGGGEPVHHPEFHKLFAVAKKAGVTLNFTCYGVDWAVADSPIVKAMKRSDWRGGIGVSVHVKKDIAKVLELQKSLRALGFWGANVMAQTVVGATPVSVTKEILDVCQEEGVPLLLLGYKTTGRGGMFKPKQADDESVRDILQTAKDAAEQSYSDFYLSVDTAFLDNHGHLLDELNVPAQLRSSPEGKFSMYIDGVTNTAAMSSYTEKKNFIPWIDKDLKEIFAKF